MIPNGPCAFVSVLRHVQQRMVWVAAYKHDRTVATSEAIPARVIAMVPDRSRLHHQLRGTGSTSAHQRYTLSLVVPLPLPRAEGSFELEAEKDEAEP